MCFTVPYSGKVREAYVRTVGFSGALENGLSISETVFERRPGLWEENSWADARQFSDGNVDLGSDFSSASERRLLLFPQVRTDGERR